MTTLSLYLVSCLKPIWKETFETWFRGMDKDSFMVLKQATFALLLASHRSTRNAPPPSSSLYMLEYLCVYTGHSIHTNQRQFCLLPTFYRKHLDIFACQFEFKLYPTFKIMGLEIDREELQVRM